MSFVSAAVAEAVTETDQTNAVLVVEVLPLRNPLSSLMPTNR